MEIDLDLAQSQTEPFRSQVCIIGAGIAGLTLAHKLTRQGIDVALLEAGGRTLNERSQSLVAAAHLAGEPHRGTHEGRFRAFGGASLRWGGQLLAFPPDASSARTTWPISAADLAPFYHEAEGMLSVDDLPYEAALFFAATRATPHEEFAGLNFRLSKWTPFSHRNMAATIGRALLTSQRANIYLNAQVTELLLARSRDRLEAVLVRTLSGAMFRFEADYFILAAGTVETSRLLLASRSIAQEGVGNQHDQVGRNFHDHLTLPAATFNGRSREAALQQFRPFIYEGTQHSVKLEVANELRGRLSLNPVLAHITLEEPEDSGLALVRELLTARQQGRFAATLRAHAGQLPRAAIEAFRLAWQAKLHHRRFVSPRTAVTLRLNAAQDAPSQSRISLGVDLDPFGVPQPIVDWHISANEVATLRRFASYMRESLAAAGIRGGIAWLPSLFDDSQPLTNLEDARHAMGGACMGVDPRTSVVDPNLTVHGLANLSICGLCVFPDGTSQLPTLDMMALTLRLAERLVRLLSPAN